MAATRPDIELQPTVNVKTTNALQTGCVHIDVLSDLPLYWRNALVPLPLLVFMGMKHLQARLNRADEHE
ncbi:hypothetical protein ACSJL3_005272 (plasmid) [Serratia nevei]|uniref:hypothetical protein n=1 Tax=Serratia nevei TaxID=2703794 RepID=UPI003F6C2CEF